MPDRGGPADPRAAAQREAVQADVGGATPRGTAEAGVMPPPGGASLVESVPNFSEGRRADVVDEIVAAFTDAHPEVLLLDRSSDPDHNRSVLTLAGPGPALVEAAVAGAAACARLIDLTRHDGVHPRMGALDVLPFVPLDPGFDCVPLALEAGRRLADQVGIPVYLYGAAARVRQRAELPSVRATGFEELALAAERDPARAPDLGGPGLHPTAGATAVGVRPFLIAYNVNLATQDVQVAKRIARAVRARDGGLPAVRALGLALGRRGMTQVSMNLLDFQVTGLATVFAAVAGLAAGAGVEVVDSEVVGLVPEAALAGVQPETLKLRGLRSDLVVEERVRRAIATRASPARQQGGFSKSALRADTPRSSRGRGDK
jgi:glutamate formiminotransferase